MLEILSAPLTSSLLGVLGTLASVVGAWLTIWYSRRAANSAEAAKTASNETRKQFTTINILADLNTVIHMLDDLRRRLETDSWEMVSDKALQTRLLLVAIVRPFGEVYGIERSQTLSEIGMQMKVLSETADRFRMGKVKAPSKPRLFNMLSDQKECVVLALAEVKERMGHHGT